MSTFRSGNSSPPRILIVCHVGETIGHLVRGLSVADALSGRGCAVAVATSASASTTVLDRQLSHQFIPLNWEWSHNSMPLGPVDHSFGASVSATVRGFRRACETFEPDVVISLPGVLTFSAARAMGVRHISVAHATYLAPLLGVPSDAAGSAVMTAALSVTGPGGVFDRVLRHVNRANGFRSETYADFIGTEKILCPHPGLGEMRQGNVLPMPFISGSYGPDYDGPDSGLGDTCLITFGSGHKQDVEAVVHGALAIFPRVIVTGASTVYPHLHPEVRRYDAMSSRSLAGRVGAVISHGGIGTVGTFASYGAPQVIVPTEVDQALTAIYARQGGLAQTIRLDSWLTRPALGRRMPQVSQEDIAGLLTAALAAPALPRADADGADKIAQAVLDELVAVA